MAETPGTEEAAASQAEAAPAAGPLASPYPVPDYRGEGNWLDWPRMTGDWGGVRTQCAENGLTCEVDVTQIAQGSVRGRRDRNNAFRYSGVAEYTVKLDTQRAGLWPAGLVVLRAKT